MTAQPTIIWLEQLATSGASEIPIELTERFVVRRALSTERLDEVLNESKPSGIFFDLDYPDRHRLAIFAETKRNYPDIPVVMVTLQHSESLAIWAYRNGALDFLVKPIDQADLDTCINRLLNISALKSERSRSAAPFSAPIPDDVPYSPKSTKDRLAPAVFYVQQHHNQHLYSDALARLCNMSASHFSRAFRKSYGVTFQEFLLRYRVSRACRLLMATASPKIAEIAFSVGFSDPSYFTRVFKRYVGVVPSEFVAAVKSGEAHDIDDGCTDDELTSSSQVVRALSIPASS